LISRYTNIIVGQLYGHSHVDMFSIQRQDPFQEQSYSKPLKQDELWNIEEPGGVILIHPALTTFKGKHPSFRMYQMDPHTFNLLEYEQYRLNITDANLQKEAIWKVAYTFTQYYGVDSLAYPYFHSIAHKMNEPEHFDKVLKQIYSEGTYVEKMFKNKSIP
jgi:hypothetical protein